jgi:hypothetical protein
LTAAAGRNPFLISHQTQIAQTANPAADAVPWLKKPTKMLNGRTILATSRNTI